MELRRILGVGTFGRVKLIVQKSTQETYALKCMRKEPPAAPGTQMALRWTKACLRERRILSALRRLHHAFGPGLVAAYQDSRCMDLLLPEL